MTSSTQDPAWPARHALVAGGGRGIGRAVTLALLAAGARRRARFGPIDTLVNNAGRAVGAPFLETDAQLWQAMLAVNLTGALVCTQCWPPAWTTSSARPGAAPSRRAPNSPRATRSGAWCSHAKWPTPCCGCALREPPPSPGRPSR